MRNDSRRSLSTIFVWLCLGAIFIALCAVIVFTRVSSAERDASLARFRAMAAPQLQRELPPTHAAAATSEAVDEVTPSAEPAPDVKRHWETLQAWAQRAEEDEAWQEFWTRSAFEMPEEDWRKLERHLDKHQELLHAIHVLVDTGTPGYILRYERGLPMQLEHLKWFRTFARLLREQARLSAHQGDAEAALELVLEIWALGDCLREEPVRMSQHMRIGIHDIAAFALTEVAGLRELTAVQTQQVLAVLEDLEYKSGFRRALITDAETTLQLFEDYASGKMKDEPIAWEFSAPVAFIEYLYKIPAGRSLVYRDEAAYLRIMERVISLSVLPWYETRPQLEEIETQLARSRFLRLLRPLFAGSMPRTLQRPACAEALRDVTMAGMLVEQYFKDHGVYPMTLDDIGPHPHGGEWLDPLTGTPYHYEATPPTFCLYSVGQNLTDDGGLPDLGDGDIVWRPAPAR